MCSLSAGRRRPHNGQRYVAGFRFWARRIEYQRGAGDAATVHSIAPPPRPAAITESRRSPARTTPSGTVRAVEQRDERIIVETDRHRITGLLRLPADGYRSRLTDYLNSSERLFLALTDVEVTSLNGAPRVERRDFVALSLRHIVLAMPVDAEDDDED
jgi:hypothetical protein